MFVLILLLVFGVRCVRLFSFGGGMMLVGHGFAFGVLLD